MSGYYGKAIAMTLARLGLSGHPRHVEAWMRIDHACLDGLDGAEWDEAVREGAEMVASAGPVESELLAVSFGLWGAPIRGAEEEKR